MKELLQRRIEKLNRVTPYIPPRRPSRKEAWRLKLDANENHFLDEGFMRKIFLEAVNECDPRFYPVEEFGMLAEALAGWLKVDAGQVAVGCGGDQLIDFLVQSFGVGGEVVSISPTFPIYALRSQILGARYNAIPLKSDLSLDVERTADAAAKADLTFICSPNNPTANQLRREDILAVVESAAGVVVVDEAYGDFADYTMIPDVKRYENLMILRSFSKSFGLAGMRVGYVVAGEELVSAFRRVLYPYGVPAVSLVMARKMLEHVDVVMKAVQELKAERAWFIDRLNDISGVQAFPSKTNFVFLSAGVDRERADRLFAQSELMIRSLGDTLGLGPCYRITVSRRAANEQVIKIFTEALGVHAHK